MIIVATSSDGFYRRFAVLRTIRFAGVIIRLAITQRLRFGIHVGVIKYVGDEKVKKKWNGLDTGSSKGTSSTERSILSTTKNEKRKTQFKEIIYTNFGGGSTKHIIV